MKKYIKPCAKAVKIDNSAILAGSLDVDTSTPTNSQYSKRGRNFIFDDEDLDFDE